MKNTAIFDALLAYKAGSERASLVPIDLWINEAAPDPNLRKETERLLLQSLSRAQSSEAKEYICAKLALIGSEASVPALVPLLAEAELSTTARKALEAIPDAGAAKALRSALGGLTGTLKVGVINSLGERRDEASTTLLTRLMADTDPQTAQAAASALGRIGTVKAGKALAKFQPKAVGKTRHVLTDAALVCAETLHANGKTEQACTILRAFKSPDLPEHLSCAITTALHGYSP